MSVKKKPLGSCPVHGWLACRRWRTSGALRWPAEEASVPFYLTHFRGQRSTTMKWVAPAAGTEADAWEPLRVDMPPCGTLKP